MFLLSQRNHFDREDNKWSGLLRRLASWHNARRLCPAFHGPRWTFESLEFVVIMASLQSVSCRQSQTQL